MASAKRTLKIEGVIRIDGEEFVLVAAEEFLRLGGDEERLTGVPRRAVGDTPVAKRLRGARQRAGLTQVELAERLGKSQTLVSQAETGSACVNHRYVTTVLKACGLRRNWGLARGHTDEDSGASEHLVGIDPVTMEAVRRGSKRDLELGRQYVWWANGR
jgi:DNA-binding XRE family transcriptional regulator